jgi:cell division protein FtsQ
VSWGDEMKKKKVVSIEERIPKLKQHRKKKANRRLILLLSFFIVLILSVVYFQSPLSHVQNIDVEGNELLSEKRVIKQSDISKDMNVWSVSKDQTVNKLKKLPEVKSAKIAISFPNSINIQIEEFQKEAYLVKKNKFFVILSNGKVLDQGTDSIPVDAPLLVGFKENDVLANMMEELTTLPKEVQHLISEIQLVPKKTDPLHISLYMNDGFEVSATIRTFSEKMVHYPSIASQLDPSKKGVIDLEVGSYFRAYETEGEQENETVEGEE